MHLKTVLAQQAYLLFYIREHSTQKEVHCTRFTIKYIDEITLALCVVLMETE